MSSLFSNEDLQQIEKAKILRTMSLHERIEINNLGIETVKKRCSNQEQVDLYKKIIDYAMTQGMTFIGIEEINFSKNKNLAVDFANFCPYSVSISATVLPFHLTNNMNTVICVIAHEIGHFVDNKSRTDSENEILGSLYLRIYKEKDKVRRLKFKNKIIHAETKAWEAAESMLRSIDNLYFESIKKTFESEKNDALKSYRNL